MNNVEKEVSANRNQMSSRHFILSLWQPRSQISGTASGAGSNSGSPSLSSNSELKMRNTSSTVSSSKSVFSINNSRGAFSTAFAVSIPIDFDGIDHPTVDFISELIQSRYLHPQQPDPTHGIRQWCTRSTYWQV